MMRLKIAWHDCWPPSCLANPDPLSGQAVGNLGSLDDRVLRLEPVVGVRRLFLLVLRERRAAVWVNLRSAPHGVRRARRHVRRQRGK
jgi:hypothetical protein